MRFVLQAILTLAAVGIGVGASGSALMACGSSSTAQPTSGAGAGGGDASAPLTSAGREGGGGHGGAAGAGGALPLDDGGVDSGAPDSTPDATPDAGPVYAAFQPKVPQIVSLGGPVLAAPRIVPILFPTTSFKAEITDYLPKGVASVEWAAQLTEYGVGAGTAAAPVMSVALPSTSPTLAELEAFIAQQVGAGAWGVADTTQFSSQLYVLFLPQGTNVVFPGGKASCSGAPNGFHIEVTVGATHVPYAVVSNCVGQLDRVTRTAWHEIGEGCTDPFKAPNRAYFKADAAWTLAFVGGENGDMCEHRLDATVKPADIGYTIQRMWSNASAAAYHDPCLPASGAVYVAAAPVLPDMVKLGASTVPGVQISVSTSRTIDVQLFSDGPTSGPFDVSASEPLGGNALSFAWNKTSGKNGDVLHLTITAKVNTPAGTVFEITSTLGASSSQWVGAVGN